MAGLTKAEFADLGREFREEDQARVYFKKNFDLFEKDGSGHMTLDDIGPALQMSGIAPSIAELTQLKELADDGTNTVNFETFLNCVVYTLGMQKTPEGLKDAFRVFDSSGRGVINPAVLRYVLTTLGETLSDEEMNDFLAEATPEAIDGEGNVLIDTLASKFMSPFLVDQ